MTSRVKPFAVRPRFVRASVVALLVLTPFVFHAALDYEESWRFAGNLRQVRDAGEPTNLWDAQPGHFLTGDAAKAARYYRAAAALGTPDSVGRLAVRSSPSPDAADALSFFDRAAALPFEGFGPGGNVNYLPQSLLQVSELASHRTHELSDRGDGNAAAASLFATVRLTRLAEMQMLGPRAVTQGVDDLEYLLARAVPDRAALTRLADAFAEADHDDVPRNWFVRQRAMLIDGMQRATSSWLTRPLMLRSLNTRLDQLREMIARTSKPWPRRLDEMPALYSARDGWPFSGGMNFGVMADADEFQFRAAGSALASIRAARLAIAAVRYRTIHGSWPADPAALVPEFVNALPIDPFRGEPMRTRVDSDGGFVAYSVGLNNRDEGGNLIDDRKFSVRPGTSRAMAAGDIGVRIPPH